MDRRAFMAKAGLIAAGGVIGGGAVRAFAQDTGGDVTLEPGEQVTVDCVAPTSTTVPATTTSLPEPTTTSTIPATTTTASTTSSTEPTTTTTTGPVFVDEPVPALITGPVQLRDGVHTMDQDVTVRAGGLLYGRGYGRGHETRIRMGGHQLRVEAPSGTLDVQATAAPGGRWSEGNGAWRDGDPCWIAPTAPGAVAASPYTGGPVGGNVALGRQAEVVNAWSDIVFEGPGDIHITGNGARLMPGPAVTLRHVRLDGLGFGPGITGRYPIHFHICDDTSRGSIVEGVITQDSLNHAFVTHRSHGVTWRQCAALATNDTAVWWDSLMTDPQSVTHDVLYDQVLVIDVRPPVGETIATRFRRGGGFFLGAGDRNVVRDCHVAGVVGGTGSGGFHWPEHDHGVWGFHDSVAHHIEAFGGIGGGGITTWQNDSLPHVIDGFDTYGNREYGIVHGAYNNIYRYLRVRTADCGIAGIGLHSMSRPEGPARFEHTHHGPGTPFHLLPANINALGGKVELAGNYPASAITHVAQNWNDGGPTDDNTPANRLILV